MPPRRLLKSPYFRYHLYRFYYGDHGDHADAHGHHDQDDGDDHDVRDEWDNRAPVARSHAYREAFDGGGSGRGN